MRGTTTVTYVGVAGGAISFGMTDSVTGCNPNTPAGDTPGTLTVLAAVLPSPFVVNNLGAPTANSDLIVSSELVNTKPETIVYTLNPKAVWSDGVPITAADFKYAWEMQRGDPMVSSTDVTSIAGYRDIDSVTGSNGGHTVTVKFKTTFADWQMLFDNLVPAHVMEKTGWNPTCSTVSPAIDLSGGPFKIGSVSAQTIQLVQNPKWWGTPANARSITVHVASSTEQLAQWMASGYVQVAEPATVTPGFLTQMTGLPGAQSDVDTSATLLQLDMASSLDSALSPDLRAAIALDDQPPGPGEPTGELGGPGDRGGGQPRVRAGAAGLQADAADVSHHDDPGSDLVDVHHRDRVGWQRELPGDTGARRRRRPSSRRRV